MEELELISRARSHRKAIAFRSGLEEVDYDTVLGRSESIAAALLAEVDDLEESRVAFLVPPGPDYSEVQWGIWRAGGIAVPLCLSATQSEWEYTLSDAQVDTLVVASSMAEKIQALADRLQIRLIRTDDISESEARSLPELKGERRAMILYTSGTTSKPKGVVTTHANIQAQIESLVEAWQWRSDDRIPLFLPLHHIHGIINILSCALWSGATIEPFARFEMATVLSRVQANAYTVFMAVPTIYVKLIAALEGLSEDERERIVLGFQSMRLMISGSAALPASIHEKWTELTGQKLLERYGMTEIGMALSNPFEGERRPGAVGVALPGVHVRLKSEKGDLVGGEDEPGEIQVRGHSVFAEYWNRPEITAKSFDQGWFRTGDVAVLEQGYYRIMGRSSVDIIKSGGYKLSALEIEAVLLEHPDISECAVIGVADETWGEAVAAAVVLIEGATLELGLLRDWCRERMSVYKIPHRLAVVDQLPRNAMGKVTKPAIRDFF
jgi:malonyl-CoA/methylmalonyl-CoA synthetase